MIWNQFKTLLLLATLTGILMFVGSLIGGATGIQFALVFSLIMNGIVFFFSDKKTMPFIMSEKTSAN